jgi:ketosteroid isomerase-like protein
VTEQRSLTELIEYGYNAWNVDDLEALLSICHPEVSYHTSGVFPGLQVLYEGKDGIRRWWTDFREPWEKIKAIPERISDRGDGLYSVLVRFEGTGRQGIETTMEFINLVAIRDRLAYRFDSMSPTEEAMREHGLD